MTPDREQLLDELGRVYVRLAVDRLLEERAAGCGPEPGRMTTPASPVLRLRDRKDDAAGRP